ncbi:DNA ligase 1 [Phtheirospermum japonicum]|uniref:DNA ligase 1 n=1 Tax=Phtheirospermum japonicum TaxID=374723 RepID=A0A830D1H1_9LAMI|nr:DNA ligase 1 [Phtheirospermum japonicum]
MLWWNLRIGAMMRTVLPALAQAILMNSADGVTDNLKDHIRRLSSAVVEAYNILPNLDLLIPSLMEKGIDFSASTLSMVPGIPIKPMLAKITNGAPQVLKIFQDRAFTCEYKSTYAFLSLTSCLKMESNLSDLFGEEKPGYFEYAREMTVESQDADGDNEATLNRMNSFLDDALRYSCEGIVVKSLNVDAGYTPSKRSDTWLKVKRDYVEGLSDSLDLVPIGAWHGNGRKAGW